MFQIRLKILREKAGLSQAELAQRLGIAQSTVGGGESGRREPNFAMLLTLSNFFQVSSDFLLGQEPLEEVLESDPAPGKAGDEDFLSELSELTPEEIDYIAMFAKFVKKQKRASDKTLEQ